MGGEVSKPRQTIMFKVAKGCLQPADSAAAAKLRERRYSVGDILSCELRKPRNPAFNRKAHALATLLIQNTDEFSHYTDEHAVLKRLQLEGDIACDYIAIRTEMGMLEHRTPQSLSFENMSEEAFGRVYASLCRYIGKRYMDGADEHTIEEMARFAGEAA